MAFTEESYYRETFTALALGEETVKSVTFEECAFEGCSFIGTKLADCRFMSCRFNDCTMSAVVPLNCRLESVSFKSCKTIGIDWTKAQRLREASFKDSQLNYSNFKLLKLPGIKMTGCEVKDADFTEADLSGGDFKDTDFEKTRFFKTDLSKADFKGARNYAIDTRSCTLKKTRFSYPEVMALLNGLDIIIE